MSRTSTKCTEGYHKSRHWVSGRGNELHPCVLLTNNGIFCHLLLVALVLPPKVQAVAVRLFVKNGRSKAANETAISAYCRCRIMQTSQGCFARENGHGR